MQNPYQPSQAGPTGPTTSRTNTGTGSSALVPWCVCVGYRYAKAGPCLLAPGICQIPTDLRPTAEVNPRATNLPSLGTHRQPIRAFLSWGTIATSISLQGQRLGMRKNNVMPKPWEAELSSSTSSQQASCQAPTFSPSSPGTPSWPSLPGMP